MIAGKKILVLFSVWGVFSTVCYSQEINFIKDTLYYENQKYFKGGHIQLDSGVAKDKSFEFITIRKNLFGKIPLPSEWARSKRTIIIDKIYLSGDKYFIRALVITPPTVPSKIWIDIKGAVDYKEVILN